MKITWILVLICSLMLANCTKAPPPPIKIAINPWPGYEFLFLAQTQGFFEEVGLNLTLVPFGTLSDAQRAYVSGRANGLASTMIEAVQSQVLGENPLKIVLIPDYSNGGDVVIGMSPLNSVQDLKGKRVGAEVSSLGIYMLHRTLASVGLTLGDVELINIEQSAADQAFEEDRIDAYVTYPPYSLEMLKREGMRTLFTSASIPFDIVDTIAISRETLAKNPDLVPKLHQAWGKAIRFTNENSREAIAIMAQRQGISSEDFAAVLGDIHVLDPTEQRQTFTQPDKLQEKAVDVCNLLASVKAIEFDCSSLPDIIYRGKI